MSEDNDSEITAEDILGLEGDAAPEIAEPTPVVAEVPAAAPRVRRPSAAAAAAAEPEARLHPILTNEQVLEAQARAKKKVDDLRIKEAMRSIEEIETARLRREEGFVTGEGAKDELVSVTLDLAPHSDRITINQMAYWHGHTYTVPRHVGDSLRDMQARGWVHQDELDGKNKTQHYQANRLTKLNGATGAVSSAPQRAA